MRVVTHRQRGGASVVVPTRPSEERGRRRRNRKCPSYTDPAWRGFVHPFERSVVVSDGPDIDDETRAVAVAAVARCLSHGAWGLAVQIVEQCRAGAYMPSDIRCDQESDGEPLVESQASYIAELAGLWLTRACVQFAATAIKARKYDRDLWGHVDCCR